LRDVDRAVVVVGRSLIQISKLEADKDVRTHGFANSKEVDMLRHTAPRLKKALAASAKRVAVLFLSNLCLSMGVYAAPGDLDLSFSADGWHIAQDAGFSEARAIAVQPDGKIVAAGFALGTTNNEFVVLRYLSAGTLDATFGNLGRVRTVMGSGNASANAVAIQPDGKIVVAGSCNSASDPVFCLARYNTNGVLDNGFGTSGKVFEPIGSGGGAHAVALQSDGAILVAGSCFVFSSADFCLARFNADGSLDTTFDGDGKVTTAVGSSIDRAQAIAMVGSGQFFVGGHCLTGAPASASEFCVVKYNADGSLVTIFGSGGKVLTDMGTTIADGYALALGSFSNPIVAGACDGDFCLARYNLIDGSLDTSFGGTGKVITTIGTGSASARAVVVQYDGQIVAGGYCVNGSHRGFCMARYNPDGSLDASFGTAGKVISSLGDGNDFAYALDLQSNGRIVVAGACDTGNNVNIYEPCVARFQGMEELSCSLDTDGNAVISAPTDSRRHLRAALGFQSASTIHLDIDGDGIRGRTDTLIHARVVLGFTGNAVTNGLDFAVNAKRTTWFAIRSYLVGQCGATLPP
jgi:uncharacterized delta-60 repeat protein